ncbi:MAG: hypothetical protein AVDCRST_MAG85-1951 [uncultured Solirubrobacteraceae bacterium]|uniref:Peptidase S8/S53 domain-containing protein n=1 Tax=uncultured Solirubrobacteraceae bacterium TaxID=1162706 RepID=A0A6J4SSS5_9ACTN|nr:MAG: hypothetical protein AVDCRST_MAG85-1951 [uncultured Solirubrobacteraceae bacterium]
MGRRTRSLTAVLLLLLGVPVAAWGAGFDDPSSRDASQQFGETPATNVQRQDTPNDPKYDSSEPDDPKEPVGPGGNPPATPTTTNLYEERFDLFGFPSKLTPLALYEDPADPNRGKRQVSGFNAAGAWKITRGRPDVEVAILDTGVNWGTSEIRTQVALNEAELPAPQPSNPGAGLGGYDLNGNGTVDVDDYKDDPRVGKATPTGQDLIKAFSNGTDSDDNGYVDDIAGWDFFDDDNDPADASSYFAAANHGTGRVKEAVERGNDRLGALGVCPKCTYVPMRIWDTFVSDQNSFAMAIVYAADNGIEVIEGADGGLYHSRFAEEATEYAYRKGVTQVYSGDDLNTGNHNYPANYDHTMLIQGVVNDTEGLGTELPEEDRDPGIRNGIIAILKRAGSGTNAPPLTYFRSANTAQYGGKSSISMQGPTGSTNTGKASGAVALVISAARDKGIELTADETRELMEQTAEDVLPGNTAGAGIPDPAQPGFDTHFGYGRANIGAAADAADKLRIPPEASIASPDWYAPVTGAAVGIEGLARDRTRPGQEFTWQLEYGVGLAPRTWTPAGGGKSTTTVTNFGSLKLAEVRAALAARTTHEDRDDPAGPTFDKTRTDPFEGQFTVRLTVRSADVEAVRGVDRKVLTALDDPTLKPGFPKRLGTGGEAPLRYSDLDGDNQQELVLPTEDGLVHAYRPDGSELPGWPVRTEIQFAAVRHLDSPALRELDPPLEPPRAPTIVDLTNDGRPEVVTTAGERIYAWTADGKPLAGWPVNPDPERANCAPSEQSKPLKHPKCGFLASPAAARLEGPGNPPAIVAAGLDGRLRAYRADGTVVPGFPVRLIDPDVPADEKMTAESINNPAIGDLDGDGRDEVVVATNEYYGAEGNEGDVSFAGALAAGAGGTSRVYAVRSTGTGSPGGKPFLPGWPIKLPGIIQNVLPLIGPGHDASIVRVDGKPQIVVSTTGGQLALYDASGTRTREIQQQGTLGEGALNLFESASVGDINGNGPEIVKYQIDLGQAANLLLVGQNVPYSHRIGAYDARTGTTAPGYPVITDDYQFLSSSTVAKVRPGLANHVIAGTGLGLLHAYDGLTGRDAPGFPKVTGGWLFAPAALSDDGRVAGLTREGYLFEWSAPDLPACQSEWPSFRHDQQGTGNYDADGTPPAAPDRMSLEPVQGDTFRLSFRSPGDDGFCGTATRYAAELDGEPLDRGDPVAGGQTVTKEVRLRGRVGRIVVRAADGPADARFNLGPPGSVARTSAAPDGAGPGGALGAGLPRFGDGRGRSAKETAKLEVARAVVRRRTRRLDVLAPITRRASGRVRVSFSAAGRVTRFTAPVDARTGRVRFSKRIPARQARRGTGIVTLRYPGDADTRSQVVRLRAGPRRAALKLTRPRLDGNRVRARGTVSRRARGVVRLQLEYAIGDRTVVLPLRARIRNGRFNLDTTLPTTARSAIATREGTVHAYVLFTGYLPSRVRGEMASFELLGRR